MKVNTEVLRVLADCTITGNRLKMPGLINRRLYVDVAGVLGLLGAKWNSKEQVHLFKADAEGILDDVINSGEIRDVRTELQQFFTPQGLAKTLVEAADIKRGMRVLEPSMGDGAIAREILAIGGRVDGYELDARLAEECNDGLGGGCACADFLSVTPEAEYDRVVMNPPFARQADIKHIRHAFAFLKPDGVLVAVMSLGALWRGNLAAVDFRRFVHDNGGEIARLPDKSFSESGTDVHAAYTVLVARDHAEHPANKGQRL